MQRLLLDNCREAFMPFFLCMISLNFASGLQEVQRHHRILMLLKMCKSWMCFFKI